MESKRICISGLMGSGKSTLSRKLSSMLNLREVSVGGIYRQNASLSRIGDPTHIKKWDEYLDNLILEEIHKGNIVIEGRTVGYLANTQREKYPDLVNILLYSNPVIRKTRIKKGTEENNLLRDSLDINRFLDKYGVDVFDEKYYDCVIDNSFINIEKTLYIVKDYIERRLK